MSTTNEKRIYNVKCEKGDHFSPSFVNHDDVAGLIQTVVSKAAAEKVQANTNVTSIKLIKKGNGSVLQRNILDIKNICDILLDGLDLQHYSKIEDLTDLELFQVRTLIKTIQNNAKCMKKEVRAQLDWIELVN